MMSFFSSSEPSGGKSSYQFLNMIIFKHFKSALIWNLLKFAHFTSSFLKITVSHGMEKIKDIFFHLCLFRLPRILETDFLVLLLLYVLHSTENQRHLTSALSLANIYSRISIPLFSVAMCTNLLNYQLGSIHLVVTWSLIDFMKPRNSTVLRSAAIADNCLKDRSKAFVEMDSAECTRTWTEDIRN